MVTSGIKTAQRGGKWHGEEKSRLGRKKGRSSAAESARAQPEAEQAAPGSVSEQRRRGSQGCGGAGQNETGASRAQTAGDPSQGEKRGRLTLGARAMDKPVLHQLGGLKREPSLGRKKTRKRLSVCLVTALTVSDFIDADLITEAHTKTGAQLGIL